MDTASQETLERKAEKRRAHLPVPERVDVAIVGSGLGGLVAGAHLARSGYKVAVFERHYVAGGCATQFARGPKRARYNFDVGVHYIGDCAEGGAIPSMLRPLGIRLDFDKLDDDGFDTLVFPGLRFAIPADVTVYRDRLVDTFPHERRAIDAYVQLLRSVMATTRILDAHDGRLSLRAGLSMALDGLRLAGIQSKTIDQVFEGCRVRDPRLRAVLLGQSGDYALPPSKVSAVLHLALAGHYFRSGAYYPRGGGQVIADRLAEAIEAAGGTVHLRRGVERILVDANATACGVRLETKAGEPPRDVRAGVVLSNADIKLTLERLVGLNYLPASWVQRTHAFEMAGAIFMTFLGIEGDMRARGMRATNYWQFDDFDVEGHYRNAESNVLAPRASYMTSASLKDPSTALHHAPSGFSNVEIMTFVPGNPSLWGADAKAAESWRYSETAEYEAKKRTLEDALIQRMDALFPGSAQAIVFRESASPLTHTRYTRATDGTGYGLAATPAQFMLGRPGARGPLRKLYFCGASTRAGHGIVGSMSSGRQAALRIAADLGRPLAFASP